MSKAVDRAAEQVYRGIWHGLVKWFKVPDEPPTLPTSPGEQLERFKPAEGFLRYLLLFFWIGLVVIDLIFLGDMVREFRDQPVAGLGAVAGVPRGRDPSRHRRLRRDPFAIRHDVVCPERSKRPHSAGDLDDHGNDDHV